MKRVITNLLSVELRISKICWVLHSAQTLVSRIIKRTLKGRALRSN